jgi:carbon storage regulator
MARLVLTRQVGEQILVGDDIVIEIVAVRRGGQSVRVAIDAPRSVKVMRAELCSRPETEREAMVRQALDAGTLGALRDRMDAEDNHGCV